MHNAESILSLLRSEANAENVAGMARFGINPERALGISVRRLRDVARAARQEVKDPAARHALAADLWASGVHEARILASILDVPPLVTGQQMEAWASEFDSWDLVDQCCGNLFDKTPMGYRKALEWSEREEEFVRRAGFSLMAYIAVHDKARPDADFEPFLTAILARSTDERNFIKKAVNWALRSIGKRNPALHERAVQTAHHMAEIDSRAARWNAKDTLRELTSEAVKSKLART